jgi:hypothetical protein
MGQATNLIGISLLPDALQGVSAGPGPTRGENSIHEELLMLQAEIQKVDI